MACLIWQLAWAWELSPSFLSWQENQKAQNSAQANQHLIYPLASLKLSRLWYKAEVPTASLDWNTLLSNKVCENSLDKMGDKILTLDYLSYFRLFLYSISLQWRAHLRVDSCADFEVYSKGNNILLWEIPCSDAHVQRHNRSESIQIIW